MTITTVIITLKHDQGKVNIRYSSLAGITGAIQDVCACENCPQSAITNIRVISQKQV